MLRDKARLFIKKLKALYGDPHYVALGLAIGVFVGVTPTIPFHTVLALSLAMMCNASKPAALIGVWVSNPFTVLFLYVFNYKVGHFFFENSSRAINFIQILLDHLEGDGTLAEKLQFFTQFMQRQIRTFAIMNVGGLLMGIPAGAVTYIVSKWLLLKKNRGQ